MGWNCEKAYHKWQTENIVTHLPGGTLIHAVVICSVCEVVKKPLELRPEYVIQGKPIKHLHESSGK